MGMFLRFLSISKPTGTSTGVAFFSDSHRHLLVCNSRLHEIFVIAIIASYFESPFGAEIGKLDIPLKCKCCRARRPSADLDKKWWGCMWNCEPLTLILGLFLRCCNGTVCTSFSWYGWKWYMQFLLFFSVPSLSVLQKMTLSFGFMGSHANGNFLLIVIFLYDMDFKILRFPNSSCFFLLSHEHLMFCAAHRQQSSKTLAIDNVWCKTFMKVSVIPWFLRIILQAVSLELRTWCGTNHR